MLAKIQRNQIHLWKDQPVLDDQGNPTGEVRSQLQLGITFTEYPDLPTYGVGVDVTGITTKAALKAALKVEILARVSRVKGQTGIDETVRQYFEDWGWADVEFETDGL